MKKEEIIALLPYSDPFLFVDQLISISDDAVSGTFTFKVDSFFYRGHFRNNPITPGVILTECMGQIGLVCLGIFILHVEKGSTNPTFAMSGTKINFYAPVYPGETVTVQSQKIYFRFNKLKCEVQMLNSENVVVAKGTIDGMLRESILE
ncbi:hydroxymyristoyl-ACP dehydratase [Aequorivita sp. SDUM287046]|uniref:Hydroxymyristoyl-ACP dehydratase n=1 Tax=Aequorivita aurantiaca TaxID=3053356 RepID=A0ABT8DHX1_9FLAO|nr:hydroxymyristoyl-ACP dehydratase [Aequorivita aurantiaca]MDN3723490.1 hydroxymyristoyl-ACP dehydratase [Aequorivita aurantiaca]